MKRQPELQQAGNEISPGQTSSTWGLYTGDEVLKERVLVGLEVKGQVPLQGLQDGWGVRQGQTLSKDPWVRLTHLVKGQRK